MSDLPTVAQAQTYLDSLDPKFRRRAATYISRLLEHGSLEGYLNEVRDTCQPGTHRYVYAILHALYAAGGIRWPYRRSEAPVVPERAVFAPSLDPRVVVEMIQAARDKALTARQAFYLAMSTTYGCRRVELANLARRDFDLRSRSVYFATAKHGRERWQVLPEQILPRVEGYLDRLQPQNTLALDRLYLRIEERIAFPHHAGLGWHSIRRSLDRELYQRRVPPNVIMAFMRWKKSSTDMPLFYAMGTVVGRDTVLNEASGANREADEAVFALHPFLPHWT